MLTLWFCRLGVATPDLSVVLDISIESLSGGHHITRELKRMKLSSYRSWEVYALAGVINSTSRWISWRVQIQLG